MLVFNIILYDVTANNVLLHSGQRNTADESFTLGGTGGDYENYLVAR